MNIADCRPDVKGGIAFLKVLWYFKGIIRRSEVLPSMNEKKRGIRILAAVLLLASLLTGCLSVPAPATPAPTAESGGALVLLTPAPEAEAPAPGEGVPAAETPAPETEADEPSPVPATEAPATPAPTPAPPPVPIDEDGVYTSRDDVALYLYVYGHLPSNFIGKKEAQALGWPGGSLDEYAYGMCIGGDRFGNYEGLLPRAPGRTWRECDIDTLHARSRGAKRIIWSNDGLIYYTGDHYESFTLLYGEE